MYVYVLSFFWGGGGVLYSFVVFPLYYFFYTCFAKSFAFSLIIKSYNINISMDVDVICIK